MPEFDQGAAHRLRHILDRLGLIVSLSDADMMGEGLFTTLGMIRGSLDRLGKPVKPSWEQQALRAFIGAAYPVCTSINPRGYNWSEAYLDQALSLALAATPDSLSRLLALPPPSGPTPKAEGGGGNTTGEEGRFKDVDLQSLSGTWVDFLRDPRHWAKGVEASGITAESKEAAATTSTPRAGDADSSGLTAEGFEAAATSTTAGEDLDDAQVPEPADWHFNRMLKDLGGKPA